MPLVSIYDEQRSALEREIIFLEPILNKRLVLWCPFLK